MAGPHPSLLSYYRLIFLQTLIRTVSPSNYGPFFFSVWTMAPGFSGVLAQAVHSRWSDDGRGQKRSR